MVSVNDRIKQRRNSLGLTLLEVAEKLGVKEATAQRYESGAIKSIKHETIVKLADILKCDPAYLMGWQEEPMLSVNKPTEESIILMKFQALDDMGKHTIKTVLDMEYARVKRNQLKVVAAHSDDHSEENVKLMEQDLDELEKL